MTIWRAGLARRRRREGGGGAQTVVQDLFTRADSAVSLGTATTGQAWTADQGTWGIASNMAYVPTPDGSFNCASLDAGVANCSVSVQMGAATSGGGLKVRVLDADDAIDVAFVDASTLRAARRIAGAFTSLQSVSYAMQSGDVLKVTMSGDDFTVYVNSVQKLAFTVSTGNTRTRHGLHLEPGGDPSVRFDNFLITVP